jgi:hypothetical protein
MHLIGGDKAYTLWMYFMRIVIHPDNSIPLVEQKNRIKIVIMLSNDIRIEA